MSEKFSFTSLIFWLFSGAKISFIKQVTQISDPFNAEIYKFTFSKIFTKQLYPNVLILKKECLNRDFSSADCF